MGDEMKNLYFKALFSSGLVLSLAGCLSSPVGPSGSTLSGCETPGVPTSTVPWPCAGFGQVVIRSRAEMLSTLCFNPAAGSPPDPCNFSSQMLVGLHVSGGCQQPRTSFPKICYYPDKVVLTCEEDSPATPPTVHCWSFFETEVYLVVPKSYLRFSVVTVTGTY
jgi:hypothetical protein